MGEDSYPQQQHQQHYQHHNQHQQQQHMCVICNKKFDRGEQLRKHLKVHPIQNATSIFASSVVANVVTSSVGCNVCGLNLSDKVALAKHQIEVSLFELVPAV